jgi:hypothetical protein
MRVYPDRIQAMEGARRSVSRASYVLTSHVLFYQRVSEPCLYRYIKISSEATLASLACAITSKESQGHGAGRWIRSLELTSTCELSTSTAVDNLVEILARVKNLRHLHVHRVMPPSALAVASDVAAGTLRKLDINVDDTSTLVYMRAFRHLREFSVTPTQPLAFEEMQALDLPSVERFMWFGGQDRLSDVSGLAFLGRCKFGALHTAGVSVPRVQPADAPLLTEVLRRHQPTHRLVVAFHPACAPLVLPHVHVPHLKVVPLTLSHLGLLPEAVSALDLRFSHLDPRSKELEPCWTIVDHVAEMAPHIRELHVQIKPRGGPAGRFYWYAKSDLADYDGFVGALLRSAHGLEGRGVHIVDRNGCTVRTQKPRVWAPYRVSHGELLLSAFVLISDRTIDPNTYTRKRPDVVLVMLPLAPAGPELYSSPHSAHTR